MCAPEFAKWLVVAFLLLGALSTVYMVGKPRKPITPGTAVVVVAMQAIIITLIISFWRN